MAKSYALDIVLYLGSIQGAFMAYLLWRKQYSNKKAVNILIFLFILLSILMLCRVNYKPSFLQDYVEIILLPDVILFLIGPLTFLLVKSILRLDFPKSWQLYLHFIPALVHALVLNTIVALNLKGTIQTLSIEQIIIIFHLIEAAAILSLLTYTLINWQTYRQYRDAFFQKYSTPFIGSFLQSFFIFSLVTASFWAVGFTRNLFYTNPDYTIYIIVWFALTGSIYTLGYHIFLNPETLELPPLKEMKETSLKKITKEEMEKLRTIMQEQSPFLNPELKIGDLALQIGLPKHDLSRIINQGFGKNFFDFVNEYRVDTFISLKLDIKNEQSSFLELAYQAGFNSKSAFNRAFQKTTGLSPSQYFKKNSKFRPTLQNGAKLAS